MPKKIGSEILPSYIVQFSEFRNYVPEIVQCKKKYFFFWGGGIFFLGMPQYAHIHVYMYSDYCRKVNVQVIKLDLYWVKK